MKQISIIAKRNEFIPAQVTELLAERGINIESFAVEAVGDSSIMKLTIDEYDAALDALREAGLEAISEDAIVISVIDEPGSLARVTRRFREADIHLRSLRILRRQEEGATLVAVSVDRTDKALKLLDDLIVL